MSFVESDGISLVRRLLDKATSSYETKPYGSTDLTSILQTELDELLNGCRQTKDNDSLRSLLAALNLSHKILCQMTEAVHNAATFHVKYHDRESYIRNLIIPKPSSAANFTSLPTELLSEIIKLATRDSLCAISYSAINRRCRGIVLQTPYLWNQLHVRYSPEVLQVSVERSIPLGLAVHIVYKGPTLIRFLSLVKEHFHRISYIYISGTEGLEKFLEYFSGLTLDNLTSLTLHDAINEGYNPTRSFSDVNMPNVKNYKGVWFLPNENPSWVHSLTKCSLSFSRFDMGMISYGQFYLPNCEILKIELQTYFGNDEIWIEDMENFLSPMTNLPKLRHLTLDLWEDYHVRIACTMLQNIPTRQLESLEILFWHKTHEADELRDKMSLLSFDNLRSFKVKYHKAFQSPMDFKMPLLEHLEVYGAFGDMGLNSYVWMARNMQSLKTLVFDSCHDFEISGILDLAKLLVNPTRSQTFEKLRLNNCHVPSLMLSRLKNIMPPEKLQWDPMKIVFSFETVES